MKYLNAIVAFFSAPVSTWASSWLDLFVQTGLAHPHWQERAGSLAIGVSSILALVALILLTKMSRKTNGVLAITLGVVFLLSLFVVWCVRGEVVDAIVASEIEKWNDRWFVAYVGMLVIVSQTVLAAMLWFLRERR